MLDLVVFSKDRPCQLELLLRSVERFVTGWRDLRVSVLYTAESEEAERGYELARALHPGCRFVPEVRGAGAFRAQTLELVDPSRPLTAFLVDDDVFKAPFRPDAPEVELLARRGELACLSLRLDPGMDRCYTLGIETPPPALDADRAWRWPGLPGDWGYPMSLDGHVFRTHELLWRLRRLDFFHPNSLEAALAERPLPLPAMACFDEARLVNVPANRVQDWAENRHAGVDAAGLNRRFLAGERIALEPFSGLRTRAPHHELDYAWEPRPAVEPLPRPRRLRPLRVGLLVNATADYLPFAGRLVESAQRHLLRGHRVLPFVFTDGLLGEDRLGFPAATLYRYHVFCEHAERLARMDYLFYCDADMLFVDEVGEEVLGRLTATQHPGFVGLRGSYEGRPESTACVGPHEGERYYCGGFNGGEAAAFLAMAETIAARIDADDERGVLAVWHDESHLNRYLVDCPPEIVLSPSYCYPEILAEHYLRTWPERYRPRLVALDKNHGAYRLERAASAG